MAFDSENARIAAIGSGMGWLGVVPWAAAGFQNLDVSLQAGSGAALADTVPPSGGSPGLSVQWEYLRRRRREVSNTEYRRKGNGS